ncbi:MAG TPA: (2Fe-2S)-binding protein, partial [candidate division Zixibacteria bacterium]|nr:(2Fe-2S)-binding protein [candidate division Zixibacteria bacterium]
MTRTAAATQTPPADTLTLKFTVNGRPVEVATRSDRSLLDVLREDLGLTGAKRGCDIGTCGSCTVIVDGKAQLSCIVPVTRVEGTIVETVEALSQDGGLHPLQNAFIEGHGFQCGICTPGFLMSAKALLDKHPDPSDKQITQAIRKNICRCTGYNQLVESIKIAAGQMRTEELDQGTYRTARVVSDNRAAAPRTDKELHIVGQPQARIESQSRID